MAQSHYVEISISKFKIPFPMFIELIDMRDHLLHVALPEDRSTGPPPEKPENLPILKARSQATVSKFMNVLNRPKPIHKKGPYEATCQELANYVNAHSGGKIRVPPALCEILLKINDDYLLVNSITVERDVFEAILQCRLHEEEGVFTENVIRSLMESNKDEPAKMRERLNESASALPPLFVTPPPTPTCTGSDPGVFTYTHANRPPTQQPIFSRTKLTGTFVFPCGTLVRLGINNAPLKNTISRNDASGAGSDLCGTTAAGTTTPTFSSSRARHSNRAVPRSAFLGYEVDQVTSIVEYHFAKRLGRRVPVPGALVRSLYGMPERGRTMKIGGESGWGWR